MTIIRLKQIMDEVVKLHSNFKKEGADRKTKSYLHKSLTVLEELKKEFSTIVDTLLEDANVPPIKAEFQKAVRSYEESISTAINIITATTSKSQITSEPERTLEELTFENILKQQDVKLRMSYKLMADIKNLVQGSPSHPLISRKTEQLKGRENEIRQLHEKLLCSIKEAEQSKYVYFTKDHYGTWEEAVDQVLTEVGNQSQLKLDPLTNNNKMPLPNLEIQGFSGVYSDWLSFRDQFTTLVHNNNNITDIHKMLYLKSKLTGTAAKLIQHLLPTKDNYASAWHLLTERYNNERFLVFTYLDMFFGQSPTTETANSLRSLHDTTKTTIHALENLGISTSTWDPILVYTIMKKLDDQTRKLFELTLVNPREIPTQHQLLEFLDTRFHSLESLTLRTKPSVSRDTTKIQYKEANIKSFFTKKETCLKCNEQHTIQNCNNFKKMSVLERSTFIHNKGVCRICLTSKHNWRNCNNQFKCLICKGNHNTLLHSNSPTNLGNASFTSSKELSHVPKESTTAIQKSDTYHTNTDSEVILATALFKTKSKSDNEITLRALIDPGSMATLISEEAAKKLDGRTIRTYAEISGVGETQSEISRSKIHLEISPIFESNFKTTTPAFVMKKLTNYLPHTKFNVNGQLNMTLADPHFNIPGPIDVLIGADTYAAIIDSGLITDINGSLVAQNTKLGWILMGTINLPRNSQSITTLMLDLNTNIKKFWELEEIPTYSNHLSEDEMNCERLYQNSFQRDQFGKYIVALPFREFNTIIEELGYSRNMALSRFYNLERRLNKNNQLKKEYTSFMQKYIDMGHMVKLNNKDPTFHGYYLPHHPVYKTNEENKSLRVVFDASAKSSTGKSLNDLLYVGPKLQKELIWIILKWRQHKYVFKADIEKMYRMIGITEDHQQFQRILWRSSNQEPIAEYKLTTVTYGTASAPFLALRTLQQLVVDEGKNYPSASSVVLNDFYVDDVLSGGDQIAEVLNIQQQLIKMLSTGGFKLKKWASNHKILLGNIPTDDGENIYDIAEDNTTKTLGVYWNAESDSFGFKVIIPSINKETKRTFLSTASRIFDPLGWVSPVTVKTKIIFQQTWLAGIDWDQQLPEKLSKEWSLLKTELPMLNQLLISRWIGDTNKDNPLELHGFCDASEAAYAAVIYSRTLMPDKQTWTTNIVAAKTKVSPINTKPSLPRLELCAAVLLCKLFKGIKSTLSKPINFYAWTDSKIVLCWIRGNPNKWKCFVGNRVAQIHEITSPEQWRHVVSGDNPADCASRGILPSKLLKQNSWWKGPDWLTEPADTWPISLEIPSDCQEEQRKQTFMIERKQSFITELGSRFSSLNKFVKVIAYCKRITLRRNVCFQNIKLTAMELQEAEITIFKLMQYTEFESDIKSLNNTGTVNYQSKLKSLHPFIDKRGLMRLHGRVQNHSMSFEEKHPIILPSKHHLTNLLIERAHLRTLHGGPQLTLSYLRNKYWILRGKQAVKTVLNKCTICFRFRKAEACQLMGSLPTTRTTPSRPFSKTGVDFAGPINVRTTKGRGYKSTKGYIALFICFSTKAIHLEVVSDLSAEGFIAAFRRFVGRRGNVSHMYSDNATNFIATNKYLKREFQLLKSSLKEKCLDATSLEGTEWHFIPPCSPHFGGLWEAGVKSMKHHIRRVLKDTTLTFEELNTLVVQIEACLNSRPLCSISENPENLEILTPGHFLVGGPLIAVAEPNDEREIRTIRNRWELIKVLTHNIWKRWTADYVNTLQQRTKWHSSMPNLQINDVVLIKEDKLPPTKWALGRINQVHAGDDGLVRVVTIRTPDRKLIKRSTTKIAKLPFDNPISSNTSISQSSVTNPSSDNENCNQITTRSKRKLNILTMILVCLALQCTSSATALNSKQLSLEPVNSQLGMYFDSIAKVNPLRSHWNLLVYFNMDSYWREAHNLASGIQHLSTLCEEYVKHDQPGLCSSLVKLLKQKLNSITSKNKILQEAQKRRKRGLINGIGYAAHELFGTLDERDAERFQQSINGVQNNLNYHLQLIKNQTSIIDATVNVMHFQANETAKHFEIIDSHLKFLQDKINQMALDGHLYNRGNTINIITNQLIVAMEMYSETQRNLFEVGLSLQQGQVHSMLLSHDQLKEEVIKMQKSLPSSYRLPSHDIITLRRLMSTKSIIKSNMIIFSILVPIVDSNEYNLYALIPIPILHHDRMVRIMINKQYILVEKQQTTFAEMSEKEIDQCIIVDNSNIICRISAVYKESARNCEMSLYLHKVHSSLCVMQNVPVSNYWIPLHNPNQFLYALASPTFVNIMCNETVTPTQIHGTGIITLGNWCSLSDHKVIISSIQTYKQELKTSFQSLVTFNDSIIKALQPPPEMHWFPSNLTERDNLFVNLKEFIKQQMQDESHPPPMSTNDIHQFTLGYGLVIIIVIIIVYFFINKCRKTTKTTVTEV